MRRIAFLPFALVAFPLTAHAQSLTVPGEASLARLDARGAQVAKRPVTLNPEAVNRQDCIDDQRIRIPIELSGFEANAALSAWASLSGVDCAQPMNRAGNEALCWSLVPAIPLQPRIDVDVPVRKLIAGATTEAVADERLCGAVDLTRLEVQLLYFAPGAYDVPAITKSLNVVVDTIGPEPPVGLRATPADGRVVLQWDQSTGSVTALSSMSAYCAPSPAAELVPGALPNAALDARFRCASVAGSTATSMVVTQTADGTSVADGREHAFATSAVDAFGNEGPLSEIATATAAPSDDEGGCTVTRGRRSSATSALVVALGALVALRRRRISSG